MFNKITHEFQYGAHKVILETGVMARQATSSVLINVENTVVLVTVVANAKLKEGQDFFPLTVDYFEKNFAIGKIPGGFFKRETKPGEHEVLIARLIDRPVRPLFPEGFYNEVHVVAQVLSLNPEVGSDIVALIGASAALSISGLPLSEILAGAKVGYINEEFVLNPSKTQLEESKLDLIVAGTKSSILMVESEAQELDQEIMLNAIMFGKEQLQTAVTAIEEFTKLVNPPLWGWTPEAMDTALLDEIKAIAEQKLQDAYAIKEKGSRSLAINLIKTNVHEQLIKDDSDTLFVNKVNRYFKKIEADIVRHRIINCGPRIDGRDLVTVRPINIQPSVLPTTHGSTLFTRGETQALAVATLGTKMDEQSIDAISGSYTERFMLHYNFPPFSTGETGRMGPPKRREIGHGNLAKRALKAVLPSHDVFPYTLRVVSEILESNGSSSMATVCGGCLALMDAGVPLKDHVAGIAMGLILDVESKKVAVLTDILGDEDHLGDMDFKVAGTKDGITALQMDIKISGISSAIMQLALQQALGGIEHILGLMKEAMPTHKVLSDRVPRLFTMQISPEKIKDVIGKGGSVIKSIIAETGASVDITDEGLVTIACVSKLGADKARTMIEDIVIDAKLNGIYDGVVTRVLDRNIGVMVSILGTKEGFVHVSQIANERVEDVRKYLTEGQSIKVKVVEFDDRGRMRLSIKAAMAEPEATIKDDIKE